MNKLALGITTIVGSILLLTACGPSQSKKVAFTGTWKIETENGISGAKDTETVVVTADKNMFRTDSRSEDGETIAVYDGEMLQEKHSDLMPPSGQNSAEPPPDAAQRPAPSPAHGNSPVHSEKMSEMRTGPRRFWARNFEGQTSPGGQIAGHETILYQIRDKRNDGEILEQGWVDANTGIALKSVETVYSSQVDSVVSRVTHECQEINYGLVDQAAFARP